MRWESLYILASTGENDLEATLSSWSIRVVGIAALIIVSLLVYSSRQKRMKNSKKRGLFAGIVSAIVMTTVFLFGSTIYLNTVSDSGGPVHWHSDIEFWVCGTEVELRDPKGALNNKIGTATYHEHNDKRLHLEGVVVDEEYDASLEKFMKVSGGDLTDSKIIIPTEKSIIEDDPDGDVSFEDAESLREFYREYTSGSVLELSNGQSCNGSPSETQVFVYSYNKEDNTYTQTKLADPKRYTMRDESVVPPGDCVIVEFGPARDATDKLCLQYGIRDKDNCEKYSDGERSDKLCTMQYKGDVE